MDDRASFFRWMGILFVFILLLFLIGVILIPVNIARWVPFPLHSSLTANYSAEEIQYLIQPLSLRVIIEAFLDQGTPIAWEQVGTIQSNLRTPVPTVTAQGNSPGGSTLVPSLTRTLPGTTPTLLPTIALSGTPPQASSTPTLAPNVTAIFSATPTLWLTPLITVPIATSTNSPYITPSRTIQPSATLFVTRTQTPSRTPLVTTTSNTSTPTLVIIPSRTYTLTWTPTRTPSPTPTRTPTSPPTLTRTSTPQLPPTRTPAPYPPPYP